MTLIDLAQHGLATPEYGLTALRIATGTFFAVSGFNKLADAGRHQSIAATMVADHVPMPRVMEWFVPTNEFVAGTALTIGLMSSFAAAILAVICTVAMCCEGKSRVDAYKPINAGDRLDDWLYLPEVIYLVGLLTLVVSGGGSLSVDNLF